MSRQCFICKKKPSSGNKVSHSNIKTKRRWKPNLQSIRIVINGKVKRESVCTKCIKAGKIQKATS
ncbi:MAG: 50S ribosomal protein L28 [Candidatus Margulisiibacteriota bacterium]|nr:50S ribosomal protein L28 [Candidatus Margulisiibacteriota bacterium]